MCDKLWEDDDVTAPIGRREANKQATRTALRAAAKRLFADRGYEATTVRDIAREANVTERTFYRYFDGKEALLGEEYRMWLEDLADAIRARPAAEPPLLAVRHAIIAVGRPILDATGPAPPFLLSGDRPFADLRRSTPRPLLRLEATVAEAVAARLAAGPGAGESASRPGDDFQAQVVARVAVAALRSAIIRHRDLRAAAGGTAPQGLGELLDRAFTIIGRQEPGPAA
jgi:AcrR family transcriptional regulator